MSWGALRNASHFAPSLAHFWESEVVRACVRACVAQHSSDLAESVLRTILAQHSNAYVYEQVILRLIVSRQVCSRIVASALRQKSFTLSAHTTTVEQTRAHQ